jgi:hypothetical protein
VTTRPLDPAEIYYEVVDRLWPTNAIGFIEIDGSYDRAQVEAAWAILTDQVPIVGARVVRTSPREAHVDFGPKFIGPVTAHDDVPTMLASVSGPRIDLAGPLARCATSAAPDGGTALVIAANHVTLDGRPMAQLLFLLARVLVDGADMSGHPLTTPTEGLSRFMLPDRDWSTRRREMLATAREIRDEKGYVGNGGVPDWFDRADGRDRALAYSLFDLTPEQGQALITWTKAHGATVHGTLTVAVLRAIAHLTPGLSRVPLSTTVDLRMRAAAPAVDAVGQSAAVVSASFDPTTDPGLLARHVTDDIRRRVERGEPELFFALSGVDKLPVGDATDKVVRQWMAASTPAANFSNLGVVTGEAPAGVRRMSVGLANTPNQVFNATAATFRGQVTFILSFDRNRLSIDPAVITETLRAEVVALTG